MIFGKVGVNRSIRGSASVPPAAYDVMAQESRYQSHRVGRRHIATQCVLFPGIFERPVVAKFDQRQGSSDGGAAQLCDGYDPASRVTLFYTDRRFAA